MTPKVFPTLYKLTSKGAVQEWTIEVLGAEILTRFGQSGKKIQTTAPTTCEGKNIGKSNETTPEQQALLEAEAQWTKKQTAGNYTTTIAAASAGESSELVLGGVLPMLAHTYSDHGEKLKFPAMGQPKLDGHRCTAIVDGAGKCTLWSRTRKPITGLPHINRAVEALGLYGVTFDGELYNDEYKDRFEELSSFIRSPKPKPGNHVVQYHIYDLVEERNTFAERWNLLIQHVNLGDVVEGTTPPIVIVETITVEDEDALMLAFERFLAQGYEGAIARNIAGHYVHKRSYDLLKIKEFDDAEFLCIAVAEGKGKMVGHAVFSCITNESKTFNAKKKGELAALKAYYEHPELVVGKMITVKYQGITKKSQVPRFPVALRIREDL